MMGLKSNFEETPSLVAPPSYLDSTSNNDRSQYQNSNIAPHYTAWKLILSAYLRTSQNGVGNNLDEEEDAASALLEALCNLRLVSRLLYSVSMSLLRPLYFPEYLEAIQATLYSTNLQQESLDRPCREMRVLDHYISYRINRRFLAARSSLLLNNDDAESDHRQVSQDLFKWLQPQTYMEDEIGKALAASATPFNGVHFQDLLVRFRFTRAGITLPFRVDSSSAQSSASSPTVVRKEVVAVERAAKEAVFVTAHRLLDLLNQLVFVRQTRGSKVWYELVGQTG